MIAGTAPVFPAASPCAGWADVVADDLLTTYRVQGADRAAVRAARFRRRAWQRVGAGRHLLRRDTRHPCAPAAQRHGQRGSGLSRLRRAGRRQVCPCTTALAAPTAATSTPRYRPMQPVGTASPGADVPTRGWSAACPTAARRRPTTRTAMLSAPSSTRSPCSAATTARTAPAPGFSFAACAAA